MQQSDNLDFVRLAPKEVGVWVGRICPVCAADRTGSHRNSRTLGVITDGNGYVGWNCKHCGIKGSAPVNQSFPRIVVQNSPLDRPSNLSPPPSTAISPKVSQSNLTAITYLAGRGISETTFNTYGLFQTDQYFNALGGEVEAIGFPVILKSKIVSVKYRSAGHGKFFSSKGSPPCLFGDQTFDSSVKHLVITEGEIDALSFYEAGVRNVMSIPSGAGAVPEGEKGYLWGSRVAIEVSPKVLIATDNDQPGQACGEELARRIGRHKCFKPVWPEGCKDANDVLVKFGPERLRQVFDLAQPWPVAGLYNADHYRDQFFDMLENGDYMGVSTGLAEVDRIYRIGEGQLSVVTGVPGSGKSEFIDQMMCNLAEREGWNFAICSFENPPHKHIRKLVEKRCRKPAVGEGKMGRDEVEGAYTWVDQHFSFIQQADGQASTIESILERARVAVLRNGIKGLVVDPYNYITRSGDFTETLWVSDMLTKVREFASGCGVHVWFVAHPQKLQRIGGSLPMPGGYDISGSAAWFAKADSGITVGRTSTDNVSKIECWKQREKSLGQLGTAIIKYDPVTGVYSDGAEIERIVVNGFNNEEEEDDYF